MTEDDTGDHGLRNSGIRSSGSGATKRAVEFANTRPSASDALRACAPIPRLTLCPVLNMQGYYAGRVERHLYWVTVGTY
jgi:hypothetical protein